MNGNVTKTITTTPVTFIKMHDDIVVELYRVAGKHVLLREYSALNGCM